MSTDADGLLPGRRGALSLLAAWCAGAVAPHGMALPAPDPELPPLRRGLNLTHWFEYERGQPVSAVELATIRRIGMDHVRLPIDPVVGHWQPGGDPRLSFIGELRAAIELALAAGLDVVLDLHMTHETKLLIESSADMEQSLARLWSWLVRQWADLPRQRVVFELFNEPQYYGWGALRWPGVQASLLAAVRERAPSHLVLLSGNEGGSMKGLGQLPLVDDAAVAYAFHYYDPFLFTHQGAQWLDTRYTTAGLWRGVRYPVEAMPAGPPATLMQPHPRAQQEMADYIAQDWGLARLHADLDQAGRFARERGVRVCCNEFGVIRAHVDPVSRYRWIGDMRQALEANGLGWTLWDYTDIFGITAESAQLLRTSPRTFESQAVRALASTSAPGVR